MSDQLMVPPLQWIYAGDVGLGGSVRIIENY